MGTYKYPAKYRHTEGTVVLFSSNKIGEIMVVGGDSELDEDSDYEVGDHRTDWTGPEGNKNWVLLEESKKVRLLEALGKLKHL